MKPETQNWVEDADYDLQSAKAMLESGRYFFVVFMCHLTIEKLLKAVIVEKTGTSPPRIHNLVGLAARCGLDIPDRHRQLVNQLDNMSVVTRYPDGRRQIADALTEERVNSMFSDTMEFAEWIRAELE